MENLAIMFGGSRGTSLRQPSLESSQKPLQESSLGSKVNYKSSTLSAKQDIHDRINDQNNFNRAFARLKERTGRAKFSMSEVIKEITKGERIMPDGNKYKVL
ncbi:MAG: hypothetical protein KKD77_20605 [Gammaproteobacteria bacterium]|nr:hypothetical protein [Gammaproteobacteria bacterium]